MAISGEAASMGGEKATFALKLQANLAAKAKLIIQHVRTKTAVMGMCGVNGLKDAINCRPDHQRSKRRA